MPDKNRKELFMKIFLYFVCIGILAFVFAGCEDSKDRFVREETKKEHARHIVANDIIGKIQYIKDPRTGLCFAYFWKGAVDGGPALATVPCEAIPPDLLITAEVESSALKK
jgi:hypothetical protein